VKLLVDENLSPTLVDLLAGIYPDTAHVRELGLKSAPDPQVWAYAASQDYDAIVTKDADFHHRSFLHGHPPKVIWIRRGNCSTRDIAKLFIARREQIETFLRSAEHSFLVLA
jgi:predicted nuclease of predicted toxin-antitoxin system